MTTGRAGVVPKVALLDVLTAIVLGLALFLLVGPGSAAFKRTRHWMEEYTRDRAVRRNWSAIVAAATPLYSGSAPADVVEFVDYECPYCRSVAATVDSALARGTRIAVIHLPLAIHSRATLAAVAAICAARTERFPDFHRQLLTTTIWMTDSLPALILSRGSPVAASVLEPCLRSHEADSTLHAQLALSSALRIGSTPTFASRSGIIKNPVSAAALTAASTSR
jgi:protein-disulfide isomerase